jgi:CRP/FNR family transcriptional regulator, anaerobic regulatory protein
MRSNIPENAVQFLLTYFDKFISLDTWEKNLVVINFKPRFFKKRQYLLQEGNIATMFYFVVSGCLRLYKFDEKGDTHIIQFGAENSWLMDISSCHGTKPSVLNIDALEDSVVMEISRDNLLSLFSQAPKFDHIFRVLIENSYARMQELLLQTISSTAEERYYNFEENHPELMKRLSQIQIASFLSITPEFLSRLRNRRANSIKHLKS